MLTEEFVAELIHSYINEAVSGAVSCYGLLPDGKLSKRQRFQLREPWNSIKGGFYHPRHIHIDAKEVWISLVNNNIDNLISLRNFDVLYDELDRLAYKENGGVCGIGQLSVYDTALSIAKKSDKTELLPRHVYLQAGAKIGAKALGLYGHKVGRECFDRICHDFKLLTPAEIEDFLCVYHKELQNA